MGFGKYKITCALGKVLAFEERKFDLFDSFGDSKPWFADDMAFAAVRQPIMGDKWKHHSSHGRGQREGKEEGEFEVLLTFSEIHSNDPKTQGPLLANFMSIGTS